jgi:hypothetical protein
MLSADAAITRYISADQMRVLLEAGQHIGDAPERARRLADDIRQAVR